jgi:type II secretory pathway predicted ATPase ExeA
MYKQYFGFSEEPFGITPDPRFFYENPIYREASTTLERGIEGRRGLMTLVGAVGTGKTTVLRRLVAQASPAVRFVLADYPPASFDELLSFISRELGLPTPESRGRLEWIGALKEALARSHAENRVTVLLLDEAQHLSEETLEGVRLLSNLEVAGAKALQIILAGQPELRARLDQPALAPLKQRITFECRLDRLGYGEIAAYLEYRLSVAGYRGPELFGPDAVEAVGFYSNGIPRLINVLCGNALIATHRAAQRVVPVDLVVECARALRIGPSVEFRPSRSSAPDASAMRTTAAADAIASDAPSIPARRGPSRVGAVVDLRHAGPSSRPVTGRSWLGVAIGALVGLLVGTGGLALLRSHEAPVKDRGGSFSTARPSGAPGGAATTPPVEATPPTSAPAPAADARPANLTDISRPTRDTAGVAAERATPPVEEATEPRPAPSRPGPRPAVVLPRGGTISGVAWNTFGPQMFLALDLVAELNPHLDNLNWVRAGQPVRLPRLDRDDLMRAQRDGSYRVILNSFPNPADARTLGEAVRARGYEVVVLPRRVADDLVLSRVEIAGLRDRAAAQQAWEEAELAAWLPRATPPTEGSPASPRS